VKPYTVVFTPEAEEQLAMLYRFIADPDSAEIAYRYTSAIVEYCEGMENVPRRPRPAVRAFKRALRFRP
jgi:toxin ParE1/3/4